LEESSPGARRGLLGFAAVVLALAIAGLLLSAAPAQAEEANRMSCQAIRGTDYLSGEERDWFWANCLARPLAPAAPSSLVAEHFAEGYRAAGGPESLLPHILNRVIPCESRYNPYAVNWRGPYYGLMQFSVATWNRAGGGDWYSPWHQGANTARLVLASRPANQWPHCWFA
jgi:hypothetical protein